MAIFKETNKNKITKDGRCWGYRCYYTDMYGKRKQKESKLYATKKEAQEAERDFLTNILKYDIVDSSTTFSTAYIEWSKYKSKEVKLGTYYGITKMTDKYILVFFKDYKLNAIKISIIKIWTDYLESQKLSTKYKNKIIGYAKEIFLYFVNNFDFDIKIASKIQKFRNDIITNENIDSRTNFWTYEEFKLFIHEVDNPLYYLIFNFLYFTGVRFGEMCALNWDDFDMKNKTIKISKTLNAKVGNGSYIITTPKTNNSKRNIQLNDNLYNMLISHYNNEKKLYMFSNKLFIFGNIKHITATTFRNKLIYYINKTKMKEPKFKLITTHGFRHSHASLLIHLGLTSRDIAERFGDTPQMIEKTYYHMFPERKNATTQLLNTLK